MSYFVVVDASQNSDESVAAWKLQAENADKVVRVVAAGVAAAVMIVSSLVVHLFFSHFAQPWL